MLLCVRNELKARYVIVLLGMAPSTSSWTRGPDVRVVPGTPRWREQLLPPRYVWQEKGGLESWSDTVCFERRTRSELGYFVEWHLQNVEYFQLVLLKHFTCLCSHGGVTGRGHPDFGPRWSHFLGVLDPC